MLATHLLDHVLELECITIPAAAITRSCTMSAVLQEHKITGPGAINVSHYGIAAMGPLGALSLLSARMIKRALAIMRSTYPRIMQLWFGRSHS
jgi:hypothetical protein